MSKFNSKSVKATTSSPVKTTGERARTAMGGNGYLRDEKSELYLLAVTNMVGEKAFHEDASRRDSRYNVLVRSVAKADGAWICGFVGWLRTEGAMRSASLVMAAEAVHERTQNGLTEYNEDIVLAAIRRADEPGEFMAYWFANFGKAMPKTVRRALGEAAQRTYSEYGWLKYDSAKNGIRFADVLRQVHVKPRDSYREKLHQVILDDYRYGEPKGDLDGLETIQANRKWRKKLAKAEKKGDYSKLLDPQFVRDAGLTWEDVMSALGSKVDKKLVWESVIPSMGYMALLRNLRNFDQANVGDETVDKVIAFLTDEEKVKRSGVFPMQIHAAYRETSSLRWGYALEKATRLALSNVPVLRDRTLILVDTSSSMNEPFSKDGSVKRWDAAVLFGLALAQRCDKVEVVSFSSAQKYWGDAPGAKTKTFDLKAGEAVLKAVDRWKSDGFFLGGGTDTVGAIRKHYAGHDRVVIITDEQMGVSPMSVSRAVPGGVPLHTFNLAGYKVAHGESGIRNRFTVGGLTDKSFRQIALAEDGANARWPWEDEG